MLSVKRGDIYYADLSPVVGSEQGGVRPVLIIQNDVGNKYSPTVIAAAITSRMGKTKLPTHIDVYAERAGLARDSVVLLEQVRTLDKRRLREKMGRLDESIMSEIDTAIAVSLGLLPHGTRAPRRPEGAVPPEDVAAPAAAEPYGAVASTATSQGPQSPQGGAIG
jgi:mRNA interferase MazF